MNWFFPLFFGVLALCAVIYLLLLLKDRLSPKAECEAVVEKRYTEKFPLTMGFARRDRQERHLTFRPESGAPMDFTVPEDIYRLCPMGTKGILHYQGQRFLRFDVTEPAHNEENIF